MVTNNPTTNRTTQATFPAGVEVENYEPSELIQGDAVELFSGHNKAQVNSSGRLLVDIGGTAEITVAMESSSVDGGGDSVQLRAFNGTNNVSVRTNASGHLMTEESSTVDVNIVSGVTLEVALDSSTADLGGDNVQLRGYDGSVMRSVITNDSGHLLTTESQPLTQMKTSVLGATNTSSSIEVDTGSNKEFIIRNRSTNDVYVIGATGSSTVTTASGVLLTSGQSFSTYNKSEFTVASAITASGTADVEVTAVGY